MIHEWLGPAMFAGALLLLSLGYPVAFSLGGVAILFGIAAVGFDFLSNPSAFSDPTLLPSILQQLFGAMPNRIFGIMENYTLLAVPYFIFMGSLLEKSGIAERLLETIGILLGRLRGGLALAVVVVGALLAASTGVVAATVVAMGLISLPIMLRYGYSKQLAAGVIVASGTLGQIIPPSLVLVVLGDQLGISVGDLFIGSMIPGLLMTGAFIVHIVIVAFLKPELAPPIPLSVRAIGGKALASRVVKVMMPPLLLILLVLGSIFFGFATPTEAGAIGCIGAIALAAANRQLNWSSLRQVCESTLKISSMVMFILIGSTAFSLVFRYLQGDRFIVDILSNLPGGKAGFLFASMVTVFVLGFFIDFFEIAFIVVPLFLQTTQQLGFAQSDLVWYGVILGANMQTSFLTPPFGFALFYLRGVAPPEVTTGDIYRGAIPFIILQLIVLLLIVLFPGIVSFLPSLMQQLSTS